VSLRRTWRCQAAASRLKDTSGLDTLMAHDTNMLELDRVGSCLSMNVCIGIPRDEGVGQRLATCGKPNSP
jgi:hypothetical protein